jgi:hypothetical protein
MSTSKITISLAEPALAALDRAASNRSGYIAHLIERRARDIVDAFAHVRRWAPADVASVAHALGPWVDLSWGAQRLSQELADAGSLSKLHVEHGVSGDRWAEIVGLVASDEALARALIVVSQEYAVNAVVRAWVDG